MKLDIKKQIQDLGEEKIKELQERFRVGDIVPYTYQCVAYDEIAKRIRKYRHPFFVKAAVSAGKTIIFAMVAAQCRNMGLKMMTLARQAEIVDQDSKEMSDFGVPNSVFCSGLGLKGTHFPIIVGSEGTVIGGLFKSLGDYAPNVIGIDECHQVNWQDIVEAEENGETLEQMMTPKGEYVNGDPSLIGTGRTQYTIIIIEMKRRCREVNKHELRIFGMTGSEYRGIEPILVEDENVPGFWREQVTDINTDYLVEFGSVVPTKFGCVGDLGYDLSEFTPEHELGIADYSEKQLKAMSDKIHGDVTMTQKIMNMVHEVMKDRICALVTCADERHCKEAAKALPHGTKYHIITGKTGEKQRKAYLDDAYNGVVQYIFQVKALTTGVNIPPWDVSVILRKIGSITLLTQLLGRGMRQLKTYHKEVLGMHKTDHLVLDFSGTMFEMGNLYFDPMLEQAQYQTRKDKDNEVKICPVCNTENSKYARRCMGRDENDNRCEHFFVYRECEDQIDPRTKKVKVKGCGAFNDIAARECRCCGNRLIDPNDNLSGKMYRKGDFCDVIDFKVMPSKNQTAILFRYLLKANDGVEFTAWESFFPESDNRICRTLWRQAVSQHVPDRRIAARMASLKNALKIMEHAGNIMRPSRVSHRKNAKGKDIIAKKEY